MIHLDNNSIKHLSICLLLSLIGGYGVAFALGASIGVEVAYVSLKFIE